MTDKEQITELQQQLAQAHEVCAKLNDENNLYHQGGWLSPDESDKRENEIDEQWLGAIADGWHSLTGKPWETRDGETPEEGRKANIGGLIQAIEEHRDESAKLQAQCKALNEALHSSTGLQLLDDRLCFDGEAFKQLQAQLAAVRESWELASGRINANFGHVPSALRARDWIGQTMHEAIYGTAGTELIEKLERLQKENDELRQRLAGPPPDMTLTEIAEALKGKPPFQPSWTPAEQKAASTIAPNKPNENEKPR